MVWHNCALLREGCWWQWPQVDGLMSWMGELGHQPGCLATTDQFPSLPQGRKQRFKCPVRGRPPHRLSCSVGLTHSWCDN